MKKSKLLIPALSIASVGAVVAPIVTSCAKAVMSWDIIKDSKIQDFTSMKPLDSTTYTAKEVNMKYAQAIAANQNIIANDIFYTYTSICKGQQYDKEFKNWYMGVSDVSISSAMVDGQEIPLYSLTLTLNREFAAAESTEKASIGDKIAISFRYNNIPFQFSFTDDGKIKEGTTFAKIPSLDYLVKHMALFNSSFVFNMKHTDKNDKVITSVNSMELSSAERISYFSQLFPAYNNMLIEGVIIYPHYFMYVTESAA